LLQRADSSKVVSSRTAVGIAVTVRSRNAAKLFVMPNLLFARVVAVGLLLFSALCVSAGPQQTDTPASYNSSSSVSVPKHSPATLQKAAGIKNFAQVTPKLYRGGQPGIAGAQLLKKTGIDIVVDMRGGLNKRERATVQKLGMEYVSIPWHCPFPSDKPFATFLKLIQENPEKKIFVHCRLGNDRTGMAVAAYRIAEEGWSADEAMNEMKVFGFTYGHHWICPTLARYEKSFPHRLKTSPAFKDLQPLSTPALSK
jgi:tyrosine-protein phosphatase SIW14